MKKLVTAFALCAAISAMAVDSDNIVGYNKVTADGAYYLIGNPFASVGGGTNTLDKLQGAFESGDQIQVIYSEIDGITLNSFAYFYLTVDADLVEQDGWYDGASVYVGNTVKIAPNQGVYFYASSLAAKSVTTSGEVSKSSVTTTFVDTYTAWSSAFPVGLNPNDSRFTWTMSSADQIQVVFSQIDGITLDSVACFYLTVDADLVDVDGWYDGANVLISAPISTAGQGVYVFAPAGGQVVETSPIAP